MSVRKSRRQYSREFKRDTVLMVLDGGHKISDVARDLDIDRSVITRWVQEYKQHEQEAFPGNGKPRPQDEELRQLRRELERVKMERDILKKAISIFSGAGK